jgi:hypothetical protein
MRVGFKADGKAVASTALCYTTDGKAWQAAMSQQA